ncbi:MAG: DnaJ C-terminal domain-containing protein [Croceibacterium sp.]
MADPYVTLGVSRSATEQEIKSAYRKLAKELHPDRNKDNPKASERFSQVTQAYDLLSDKSKRSLFDRGEIDGDGNPKMPFGGGGGFGGAGYRSGAAGGMGAGMGGAEDLGDIFEGLFGSRAGGMGSGMGGGFGRRQPPPQRGANVAYNLRVPFADAARQEPQRITLGDGATIDLKLPAGVETGTQMRLKGKGQPGPAGAGDAIVTIQVDPHAFFRRDGDDVTLDLPITLDEAVKGAKVKVPTVDGAVMLTVAAGSNSGKVLRLKGKGFSRKDGSRGDQRVTLAIQLPADVTQLAERLGDWQDSTPVRARLGL